jgi:hypothetical protein
MRGTAHDSLQPRRPTSASPSAQSSEFPTTNRGDPHRQMLRSAECALIDAEQISSLN